LGPFQQLLFSSLSFASIKSETRDETFCFQTLANVAILNQKSVKVHVFPFAPWTWIDDQLLVRVYSVELLINSQSSMQLT